MLVDIFYWIFSMSIVSSFAVCIVLLVRRNRSVPRSGIRLLWFIPMIRFVMFAGISSRFSFMSLLNKLASGTVVRRVPVSGFANSNFYSAVNCVQSAVSYHPIVYQTNVIAGVFAVAAVIWAIVAAALLLALWSLYFLTLRELRDGLKISGNVCYSERVDTPAVYGVFRPRIILPAFRSRMDNRYILLHEQTHIRSLDNLWRMLAFSVASLHWFNPMAWIFLRCFLVDLELACDEKALKGCSEEERKAYALSLLNFAEQKTIFVSAFGGACVKVRLQHILNYREATWISSLIFTIFCTVVICLLLTNPV